jgi:uncharacterized iron-regulated membrane protein
MQVRKLLYKAHLYVGLLLGSFFLLLALTGSLLVFYPEIDLWINPQIQAKPISANIISIDEVIKKLRTEYPNLKSGWRIEMPLQEGFPIFARYLTPEQQNKAVFAPMVVSINPSNLEITSARVWGDYFVTWVFDLHYQLLMGKVGKTIVVIIGLLLAFDLLVGIYLWFPKSRKAWRHALTFKTNAHTMRNNYDIHKLTGVFGLLLLLTLAVTGAMLGRADWFNPIINRFSLLDSHTPLPLEDGLHTPISADAAVAIAKSVYPQAELRWVYTPNTPNDYYQLRLHQAGEPGRRFPKTIVWINPFSAEIAYTKKPETFTWGDIILAWLHPLHNGEAFGLVGRWLAFSSGLLIVILCWTGFKRSLYKFKIKRLSQR